MDDPIPTYGEPFDKEGLRVVATGRVRPKEQFHPTTIPEEAKANPSPKNW
jgi:hypothetical protein